MKKETKETNNSTLIYLNIMTLLSLLYIFFICLFMVSHQLFFSRGQLVVFALFGFLLVGRSFYRFEWAPFVFFFLGYEFLRGIIPFVIKSPHIYPMIKIDKFLFGFLPNVRLQNLFYTPGIFHWYDYLATAFYNLHLIVPIIAGYFFWKKDKILFKKFALGILILSYTTYVTYILFPAMPPWLASVYGYVPHIQQITPLVIARVLPFLKYSELYREAGANPVGAIPSLHAAFPLLIFLFAWKKSFKTALFFIPYILGMWISVIYLGEHYVTDIILGICYTLAAFVIVEKKDTLIKLLRFKKI